MGVGSKQSAVGNSIQALRRASIQAVIGHRTELSTQKSGVEDKSRL